MRYFVEFAYDGSPYHGWQRQPNAHSVQEAMEEAFSLLLGESIQLTAAGRTDTGVHARYMVAHFDTTHEDLGPEWIHKLNSYFSESISLIGFHRVPDSAHARFDAVERCYEYIVLQKKDPFMLHGGHYIRKSLNVEAMNKAAAYLLGTQDFECFSKSHSDVKTFICDVRQAQWTWKEDRLVFHICADRFLRNMVRAVVGTLLDIGSGKREPEDVKTIINSGKRSEAGPSVPAKGLYLVGISYPKTLLRVHGSGDR